MAMCSHFANGVTSTYFFSNAQHRRRVLLTPILRSSLSTQAQPEEDLPFIAKYLVSSFGFSLDRALQVSDDSHFASVKSPARPRAVIKFLRDTGLSDAQIKSVVSFKPVLLASNVEKTLKPKVRELRDAGCSEELLVQLIRYNPTILLLNDTLSRLRFWRDFVGNSYQALLKIIQRNSLLITYDIYRQIIPRIDLLKEYGLSNSDILLLLRCGTRCMSQNLDSLRQTLELIEELGISRGSKKFMSGLKAVGGLSEDTIKRKVELLKKTYGWSQEDICSAFRKSPKILTCSEENLNSKMDFLIGKAGIEPRSIASYPAIFGYSLEGVLMARYNVLSTLKAKGLKIKCSLFSACHMSEKRFYESYVVPFEKDVPGLRQAYVAAYDVKKQL